MPVTKAKKTEVLQNLEEKFSRAKSVYFSMNKGVPVKKMTDLRKKLHKEGIDLVVAKKTLIRLAAKKFNVPEISDEIMVGPIAAAFSYEDEIAPARVLYQFSKENETLELVGGIVGGAVMNKAQAKQLATLPSKQELLAKLVGSMKAPISGFHGSLAGVLRKFVHTVKAVHDKKAANPAA